MASSSIDEVGSTPADNKNNTGSVLVLDASIESIVSVTGFMYESLPKTYSMNSNEVVKALSSRKALIKQSFKKLPISGSFFILSSYSGMFAFSGSDRS